MERYLEPCDESHVSRTRNATELSRFCERLVKTFLGYRATQASVSVERTKWDVETLYKGLWNTCARRDFRGRVCVHKQDGQVLLIRGRKERGTR